MARVSFTLRRPDTDADRGSYLRLDDTVAYEASGAGGASVAVGIGSRVDYDSALRADGLQLPPTDQFGDTFFSATSVCYGEVSLEWAVNVATVLTGSPQVMGIVLVYSDKGEPQTISSGTILVESPNTFSFEHTGLSEGRWAYYSLFVNYRSNAGDNYFERVASLSEIVPKNYGSTLTLWDRIPEYYRYQDTQAGDLDYSTCVANVLPGTPVGPLFKFLSIFGFDMDRTRTLLDYVMVAQDPALANTETLDALSEQMGLDLLSSDLGAARLRTLLSDIGYFRRSKGTLAATEYFGKAVSGGDLSVDTDTGEITVYSQRTNYITDPKNASTIITHRGVADGSIPTQIPFTADDSHLFTPGISGSYASSPDGANLDFSQADIEIVVKVSMDDWTPGNESCIISKRAGSNTQVSFSLGINTAGRPILCTSVDGTTAQEHTASATPSTTPNGKLWIKATRDADNGSAQRETKFYTAPDEENEPSSWTQLGTTQVNSGVSGVFNGTAPLEFGGRASGTETVGRFRVYRAIVRDGIAGPVLLDADFEHNLYSSAQTTFAEQDSGAIISLNGSAQFVAEAPPAGTYDYSANVFSSNATGDTNNTEGVLFHLSSPVPVRVGMDKALVSIQGHTGDNPIEWVRLVDSTGLIIGREDTPIMVSGRPFYEIDALSSVKPEVIMASDAYNGNNRSLTWTLPQAPLAGDVLVYFWNHGNANVAHTYPADGSWVNALGPGTETLVASDSHSVGAVYHVVTAAEAEASQTQFTVTNFFDSGAAVSIIGVCIRNADPTNPIAGFGTWFNSTNQNFATWPAVTPDADNSLVLAFTGVDLGGVQPLIVGPPPGWTFMDDGTLGSSVSGYKYDRLVNDGQTAGPWSAQWTTSNEELASITLAIRPLTPTSQPIGSWVTGYVEVMLDLRNGATFTLEDILVERNHIGEYFDGDTIRGGWLIDTQSVSDYRWSGSANASASIFAEEYERTKGVIQNILFDVLPVTEEAKYTIVKYNGIPGLD